MGEETTIEVGSRWQYKANGPEEDSLVIRASGDTVRVCSPFGADHTLIQRAEDIVDLSRGEFLRLHTPRAKVSP